MRPMNPAKTVATTAAATIASGNDTAKFFSKIAPV
ncbi:MAG: hypothetical protein A07HN63_01499 [uncultured archaeon A07HN63]|nr:MAG: hypothetical protein A07HN63_01499 [uncultured archaeon A07HN63]